MNRVLSIIQTHKGRKMEINHKEIHKFENPIVSCPVEDPCESLLLRVHLFHGEVLEFYSTSARFLPPRRRLNLNRIFYLIIFVGIKIFLKQFLKHVSLFQEIL